MRKFGCISPSVIQLPWDLHAVLPPAVTAALATLNVRNGSPGEHERALSILRGATDVLIVEGAESIVVFGVPVAAKRGYAAERAALTALTADRGGVPIVSSLAATALAFQHLGVKHPLLITQYAEDVNAEIIAFYRDAGVEAAGGDFRRAAAHTRGWSPGGGGSSPQPARQSLPPAPRPLRCVPYAGDRADR